jgi:hypothetical protein
MSVGFASYAICCLLCELVSSVLAHQMGRGIVDDVINRNVSVGTALSGS